MLYKTGVDNRGKRKQGKKQRRKNIITTLLAYSSLQLLLHHSLAIS